MLNHCSRGVWLIRFLQELDLVTCALDHIPIYCYNMVAFAYMQDPKYHGKTKHIRIQYHYSRDMIVENEVVLEHISTSHMVVDTLT